MSAINSEPVMVNPNCTNYQPVDLKCVINYEKLKIALIMNLLVGAPSSSLAGTCGPDRSSHFTTQLTE